MYQVHIIWSLNMLSLKRNYSFSNDIHLWWTARHNTEEWSARKHTTSVWSSGFRKDLEMTFCPFDLRIRIVKIINLHKSYMYHYPHFWQIRWGDDIDRESYNSRTVVLRVWCNFFLQWFLYEFLSLF